MKYGQHRFARFAKVVWEIPAEGKTEEEMAQAGITALENWIKEIGAASDVEVLGVTQDMVDEIAAATILGGGYKPITKDDVVEILKNSFK